MKISAKQLRNLIKESLESSKQLVSVTIDPLYEKDPEEFDDIYIKVFIDLEWAFGTENVARADEISKTYKDYGKPCNIIFVVIPEEMMYHEVRDVVNKTCEARVRIVTNPSTSSWVINKMQNGLFK